MTPIKLHGYIIYYELKKTCSLICVQLMMYLFNGPNGLFKPTTCLNNKPYIWIDFMNPNIGFHTQHKNAFMYRKKKIQSKWTPIQHIVKETHLSK